MDAFMPPSMLGTEEYISTTSSPHPLSRCLSTPTLTMTLQHIILVVRLQSACLADAAGAHAPPLREQEVPPRGPVPVEQGRERSSASGDSRPSQGETLSLPDMIAIVMTAATGVTVGNVPQRSTGITLAKTTLIALFFLPTMGVLKIFLAKQQT